MKYAYAAAAAAFTALAVADNVPFPTTYPTVAPTLNAAQSTSVAQLIESDLSTLITGLANDPSATGALEAIATLTDGSGASGLDLLSGSQITGTPSWWSELPSSAQVLFTSLMGAEYSIYTKDIAAVAGKSAVPTGKNSGSAGAAPTQAPAMAAAGLAAAGVVAGAALLL